MKALIIGGSGSLSGFLAQKVMKQYEVWAVTRGQRRQEGLQEQILRGEALRWTVWTSRQVFRKFFVSAALISWRTASTMRSWENY